MKHEEYKIHVAQFLNEMADVTMAKNPDYSMNDDAMNNFKAISTLLGGGVITPQVVWAVLVGKHITAIMTHMAQGKSLKSETIHGRFIDLANYATLGDALVKDLANSLPENASTIDKMIGLANALKSQLGGDQRTRATHCQRIDQYIITQLESMKHHDQHGSQQSEGPVPGNPEDVRDSSENDGGNGASGSRQHTSTHPPHFAPNYANAGNAELRRDRQ